MARMEKGELAYSDNDVTWRGKKYPRKEAGGLAGLLGFTKTFAKELYGNV